MATSLEFRRKKRALEAKRDQQQQKKESATLELKKIRAELSTMRIKRTK